VAYSTNDNNYLLNVAAATMSAIPDDPDYFVRWVKSKKSLKHFVTDDLPLAYLPRSIYGKYPQPIFDGALKRKPDFIQCTLLNDEAKDIIPYVNRYLVVLHANKTFTADKVVLATGNFSPAQLPVKDEQF
jgi:uncharacterized NAD(P)/FAD-binding protein YdhS